MESRIHIGSELLEQVNSFTYLVSKINRDGQNKTEVRSRIAQAQDTFKTISKHLRAPVSMSGKGY